MKFTPTAFFLSLACLATAQEYPPEPADGVLNRVTYDLGDRFLTVEEVTPSVLPTPPKMVLPEPASPSAGNSEAGYTPIEFVALGAVIYIRQSGSTMTLVTYRPKDGDEVVFWSSADWRLLAGLSNFSGENGTQWGFLMMPQIIDLNKPCNDAPDFPDFADVEAPYLVTKGEATAEQLEPIKILHEIYIAQHANLLATFNAREAERIRQEEELRNNPPVPQNIVVRTRMLTPEEIEATKPDAR